MTNRVAYTFTKLQDSIREHGGKRKFGAEMNNRIQQSIAQRDIFCDLLQN